MSNGRLQGKTALITGGSSGIGRAGALRFSQEGARVAVVSTQRDEGTELVERLNRETPDSALFVEADVSRAEDVERAVHAAESHFGRLDVLWSNAGIGGDGTAPETSLEVWERVIGVNLSGGFFV